MPIFPADMAKARRAAENRAELQKAERQALDRQHERTLAEAEQMARDIGAAFDLDPEDLFPAILCARGRR